MVRFQNQSPSPRSHRRIVGDNCTRYLHELLQYPDYQYTHHQRPEAAAMMMMKLRLTVFVVAAFLCGIVNIGLEAAVHRWSNLYSQLAVDQSAIVAAYIQQSEPRQQYQLEDQQSLPPESDHLKQNMTDEELMMIDPKHDMTEEEMMLDQCLQQLTLKRMNNSSSITNSSGSSSLSRPFDGLVVDMLSIGSVARPHYQHAQQRTFGAHASVRNFFPINEMNDTERDCYVKLSSRQVFRIQARCSDIRPERVRAAVASKYPLLFKIKRLFAKKPWLQGKPNPTGWLCAQKRPIDGLINVFRYYQQQRSSGDMAALPDYLFIVDDDTYINMNQVLPFLIENYSPRYAFMVAGCMLRTKQHTDLTMAYGGWGTFLTRPAIENFIRPIYCNKTMYGDPFHRNACKQLLKNNVGERRFYRSGISVADLLYQYTFSQPYLSFDKWNPIGFCMHSDVAIGYFANYYHIPIHSHYHEFAHLEHDRLRGYNDSMSIFEAGDFGTPPEIRKQCNNRNDTTCFVESHLCHYVTPDRMEQLHQVQECLGSLGSS